ncbi:sigma-54 dependent transcriptional regulator [Desulforhopalus sp. IMCC35007]|uniref:sigma-54-dependent transcriptional regulator n=1 Tax=Desulforhopalus sp. IMCC35007 TaxID=2569543 RepID=UPI0010AEA712|nr:sigma-54 dependent transcriptional regulator [Desulforhopalus sp. IMCC35007]TKB12334.1 sigma-54-dependent Fis family transcriptional regulator [Desulforhopalus sp. IMCC35007]
MGNVLIIDDHLTTCTMLQQMIERIHHHAEYCHELVDGLNKVRTGHFDVVFLDVNMPDGNGLDTLKQIKEMSDPPEVIIITGVGTKSGAELAVKNGAWDYIQKPLSPKEILLPIKRVLEYRENYRKAPKSLSILKRHELIGNSPQLSQCLEQLARAAENESNVLFTGETGTGKEVFARALHANSCRSGNRLVTVDCSTLPDNLIADTLFGHEKGAFTGADRRTTGLIKLADGGSLFLDEIGDLDPNLQKTLLRVLQEKKFMPVGSINEVFSDFRLIAATHKDLKKMVKDGQFREDLYFRLHSQVIMLPPLRERIEDIEILMMHYMRKLAEKYNKESKGFSPDYLDTLKAYNWPGNIREFMHAIEDSFHAAGSESILFAKHLAENIRIQAIRKSIDTVEPQISEIQEKVQPSSTTTLPTLRHYRDAALDEVEKSYLLQLMAITHGKIKEACSIADIGRTRLYNLLKKHNISRKNN